MIERLRDHIRAAGLFPTPGRALVAVSGGPDSIALLYLLHALRDDLAIALVVGHVDHGIHPRSGAWAGAVQQCATALHLPVHIASLELGPDTAETAARTARYAALERLRLAIDARYVVTAHHADDQVETVLFRVLRGSAPAGLAGMAAVRGPLVRPLLPFRRDELVPFAKGAITDPANSDTTHDRSWIRSELLPFLRQRFGDRVDAHMLDLGRHAAEDREAWEQATALVPGLRPRVAEGSVALERAAIARLPAPLAAAILRGLTRQAGLVLRPRHAGRLVDFVLSTEGGRRLELGGGLEAELTGGVLTLRSSA